MTRDTCSLAVQDECTIVLDALLAKERKVLFGCSCDRSGTRPRRKMASSSWSMSRCA